MRITACLLAALFAAPAVLAQETIEWSAGQRLARSDFRGRVPAGAQHASLSWINIDAEWGCETAGLVTSVRAAFDPSRSWWRSPGGSVWGSGGERTSSSRAQQDARRSVVDRDMQLLEHEQLHFDIAEVAARKIRARFEALKDACGDPGGTGALQQVVADADRDLQEEQQRYDRETSHGVDARAQDQWKRRIRALLR